MYGPLAVYCSLLPIIMMADIENHVSRLDDLDLTMLLLLLQAAQSELMHIDKLNHDMTKLMKKVEYYHFLAVPLQPRPFGCCCCCCFFVSLFRCFVVSL